MSTTADNNTMVISVPEGARVEVTDDGRTIKIIFDNPSTPSNAQDFDRRFPIVPASNTKDFDSRFPIVPASQLSLEDDFMKHKPETKAQWRFEKRLTKAIKKGLKDFRVSAMDPSFDANGKIVYEAGNKPAVGKSANWWKENLKNVMPQSKSRMGTKTEYVAFYGYIIKYLVSIGWEVGRAWRAICDDSKNLGHYWNSENAKHDFEPTGSRLVGTFYDLANTCKILENDDRDGGEASGFVIAGGNYGGDGDDYPLADLDTVDGPDDFYISSVGWLVLSA